MRLFGACADTRTIIIAFEKGWVSTLAIQLSLIILDSIEYHAEIIARFKLFQVLVISKSICNELPESSRGYLISFLKFVPQMQYNLFDLSPLITRI